MEKVITYLALGIFIVGSFIYLGLTTVNEYKLWTDKEDCTVIRHETVFDTVKVIEPNIQTFYDTVTVTQTIASADPVDDKDELNWNFFLSIFTVFLIANVFVMANSFNKIENQEPGQNIGTFTWVLISVVVAFVFTSMFICMLVN